MKHWKPLAIGTGIASAALLSYAMMDGGNKVVTADDGGNKSGSFLSRLTGDKPETATIPSGTTIQIRLEEAISTEKNYSGDRFTASLNGPLIIDGNYVAPSRSQVIGQLIDVEPSGRVEGRARMTLELRKLIIDNSEYEIATEPKTLVAKSTKKKDAKIIAGSAALGAAIGAIAGGGKGAAIGAGVGGGSGTGYVLATKGDPVAYGSEAKFTFTLAQPLELPVIRKMDKSSEPGDS
ncbi:MAG: hypothetical protein A3F68_06120 [Acidobacteria bacterium RIFCSPLOWO2_12_FULL_54_10]|nr:MAG: hypothetical protein A3F68_06120 [Acidobacteria bacterium RIFCSPLOWO2_12_FULL_54_10]